MEKNTLSYLCFTAFLLRCSFYKLHLGLFDMHPVGSWSLYNPKYPCPNSFPSFNRLVTLINAPFGELDIQQWEEGTLNF